MYVMPFFKVDEAIGNTASKSVAGKEMASMRSADLKKVKSDIGNNITKQTNKLVKQSVIQVHNFPAQWHVCVNFYGCFVSVCRCGTPSTPPPLAPPPPFNIFREEKTRLLVMFDFSVA